MPDSVPLQIAASRLGISPSQLRRDVSAGAPVAHRGGPGRGRASLFDIEAVAAWRRTRSAPAEHDHLRVLAAEMPELVAAAVNEAFIQVDGPHKRAIAGALAGTWYYVTTALLDRIRRDVADIPDVRAMPEKIAALRAIFDDSGMMSSSDPHRAARNAKYEHSKR